MPTQFEAPVTARRAEASGRPVRVRARGFYVRPGMDQVYHGVPDPTPARFEARR